MPLTDPRQLRAWLSGVDYPAEKNELVTQATRNGAPEDVLAALRSIPPVSYASRSEVATSVPITAQQTDGEKAEERREHSHAGLAAAETETAENPIVAERGDNPKS
jgi:hypothetical protein